MWGTWLVLAAVCFTGTNFGVFGENVMGRLHWCNTLCMCEDQTNLEVKCFARSDIYELLGFSRIQVIKLEKTNWKLENQVLWCNDTCLCHQQINPKVFNCIEENDLQQFISNTIGDMYFTENDESPNEREEEEDVEEDDHGAEHRKRSEERRKLRKNQRKPKKRGKSRPELVTEISITTTTPTRRVVEVHTTPQTEVDFDSTPDQYERTLSTLDSEMPTTLQTLESYPTTAAIAYEPSQEHEEAEMEEDDEDYEEAAEILPKQEAVAASPAVTAMQPPTRRQPFPPTASSQASSRDVETLAPKVSAVLEVPVQRKTVASEVSQDLDELGSAVMQIKSDVVLNQMILLVTVAVAGFAMLGVLVLAVHSCLASRRQAAAHSQEKRPKESSPKDDNHVTKVNLEEAW